jgi:hypothetical protein
VVVLNYVGALIFVAACVQDYLFESLIYLHDILLIILIGGVHFAVSFSAHFEATE